MSQPVSIAVHPGDLANVLHNAITISKEKSMAAKKVTPLKPEEVETLRLTPQEAQVVAEARAGTHPVFCGHILLAYEPTQAGAVMVSYGMGRYTAGRSTMAMDGRQSEESVSVALDRSKVETLQSMLRKIKGGRGATVTLAFFPEPTLIQTTDESGRPTQKWVSLTISNGAEVVAELLDSDPNGASEWCWDKVDMILQQQAAPAGTPVLFLADVLNKLKDIKADGPGIDLKQTSHDQMLAVAMGSNFRGIVATAGRELYAMGGQWGDGPGRPAHLLDVTSSAASSRAA